MNRDRVAVDHPDVRRGDRLLSDDRHKEDGNEREDQQHEKHALEDEPEPRARAVIGIKVARQIHRPRQ
jgi:hypothetical protein